MTEPDEPTLVARPQPSLLARVLAVAYVLSYAVQPVGFVALGFAAALVYRIGGGFGPWVLALSIGSGACAVLCPAFRWCMRQWRPE